MEMLENLVKSLHFYEQLSQSKTSQGLILKISLIEMLASPEENQTDLEMSNLTTVMQVCIISFDSG